MLMPHRRLLRGSDTRRRTHRAHLPRTQRARRSEVAAAVAVCALLAGTTTAHAYTTAEDFDEEFREAGPVRWTMSPIVVRFLHDELAPITARQARAALDIAAAAWNDAPCSFELRTAAETASPSSSDGVVVIQWIRDWDGMGLAPSAAGTTDVYYRVSENGEVWIEGATVYLNQAAFSWEWAIDGMPTADRDLQAVVAHELGHVLGLGHSEIEDSLMFATYRGRRTLHRDDIAGCEYLYGASECGPEGCDPPSAEPCDTSCPPAWRCTEMGCEPPLDEMRCDADGCEPGVAGDPCTSGADCAPEFTCTGEGYCAATCDGRCPSGYRCAEDASICEAEGRVFGELCVDSSDCAGPCLAGATPEPFCTRTCRGPDSCPPGYDCRDAEEGIAVCAPGPGGCAIARSTRTPTSVAWCVALSALALLVRRRKIL